MLDANFSGRFDALIRNKSQTVYAGIKSEDSQTSGP